MAVHVPRLPKAVYRGPAKFVAGGLAAATLTVGALAYTGAANRIYEGLTGGSQQHSVVISTPTGADVAPTVYAAPTEAPAPTVVPRNEILYEFAEQVTERDRQLIAEGAESARDYYYEQLDVYLSQPTRVQVIFDPNNPLTAGGGSAIITVNAGNPRWASTPELNKRKILAHEYFHLLQASMPGVQTLPSWMIEGSAEYAGYRVVTEGGFANYQGVKRDLVKGAGVGRLRLPRLDSDEGRAAGGGGAGLDYAESFLAVDYLVGDSGVGLIWEFFDNLYSPDKVRVKWEDAFLATFGEDISSFADRFETYRAQSGF